MEIGSWALLGFVFWMFGYLKSKYASSADGKLLVIPKWINILACGFPQSKDVPKYSVLLLGLRAQIIGWLLVIYGLFFRRLISDDLLSYIVGFVGSLMLSVILVNLFSREKV